MTAIISGNSSLQALPGDSLDISLRRLRSRPLLSNITFKKQGSSPYIWHEATIPYNGATIKISVSPPSSDWDNAVSHSILITQSSIGSRLSAQDYNLRQDEAFLEIVRSIWGEEVAQDFISSRFTDKRREITDEYRTAYKGDRFGYIANIPPSNSYQFHFSILSHNDWEFRRMPFAI
jgi:hypothetical protein